MIDKITNIKLGKSEEKTKNKWLQAKARKKMLLSSTDWTQLRDAPLQNQDDFTKWRKQLRKIELQKEFDEPEQALQFLDEYSKRCPTSIFLDNFSTEINDFKPVDSEKDNNSPPPVDLHEVKEIVSTILKGYEEKSNERISELRNEIDEIKNDLHDLKMAVATLAENIELSGHDNNIEEITYSEAVDKAKDILLQEKDHALSVAGVMDYPIVKERIEQATDYLVDEDADIDDYSLLKNNGNESDREFVEAILQESKEYFKNLYAIEQEYLHKLGSVYSMSCTELNELFEKHGYRYRCKS